MTPKQNGGKKDKNKNNKRRTKARKLPKWIKKNAKHIPKSGNEMLRLCDVCVNAKANIIQTIMLKSANKNSDLNKAYDKCIAVFAKTYNRTLMDILSCVYVANLMQLLHDEKIITKTRRNNTQKGGGSYSILIQFYIFAICLLSIPASYAQSNALMSSHPQLTQTYPTQTKLTQTQLTQTQFNTDPNTGANTDPNNALQPFIRDPNQKKPHEETLFQHGLDNVLSNGELFAENYANTLPSAHGIVEFNAPMYNDHMETLKDFIVSLNKNMTDLNRAFEGQCLELVETFIHNDNELIEMFGTTEMNNDKKNTEIGNNVYKTQTSNHNNYIDRDVVPKLDVQRTKEDYQLAADDKYFDGRNKRYVSDTNTRFLKMLCEKASPAPLYEVIPSRTGINSVNPISNSVDGFVLHSHFPNPDDISVMAATVQGEIVLIEQLLEKYNKSDELKRKITDREILKYKSLKERLNVFQGILLSGTQFDIGTKDVQKAMLTQDMSELVGRARDQVARTKAAFEMLNMPFPEQQADLNEFTRLSKGLRNIRTQGEIVELQNILQPLESYQTVALNTGETIGKYVGSGILIASELAKEEVFGPLIGLLQGFSKEAKSIVYCAGGFLLIYYLAKPLGQRLSKGGSRKKRGGGTQKKGASSTSGRNTHRSNSGSIIRSSAMSPPASPQKSHTLS